MALSLTGIVPARLISPLRLREFMDWLTESPYTLQMKRELLVGWRRATGGKLSGKEFSRLVGTGIDGR